jgi:uncharacterized membrane protein YkoI
MDAPRTARLFLCLCVAFGAGAHASAAHEMSMEQAVKQVERQYHAHVVKAESHKNGEHTTYVLKLLNDAGRVWTVKVDAATGAIE